MEIINNKYFLIHFYPKQFNCMKNLFSSKYRKIENFFKYDISSNTLLTKCPIQTKMNVPRNKMIVTKVAANGGESTLINY